MTRDKCLAWIHTTKKLIANPAFFVTFILLMHLLLSIDTIRNISQTHDEASSLFTGYTYLKNGDLKGPVSPHFSNMWAALPLLYLQPTLNVHHPFWNDANARLLNRFYFADEFLYKNKVDPEVMLNSARVMMIVFSLLLGLIIFWWANEIYGVYPGFIALVLWCFSSNFIAFGTLVTSDMSFTLFCFASIYFFWKWTKNSNAGDLSILLTGACIGFACVTKHSAVFIFPIVTVIYIIHRIRNKTDICIRQLCIFAVALLFIIALTYRFLDFPYYLDGLKRYYSIALIDKKTVFLLGKLSSDGWFYYFPVAFILKTPIPFLVLLLASARIKMSSFFEHAPFILIPPASFLFASCFASSNVQIGIRYILPIYPFLILWVAGSFTRMRTKMGKILGVILIVWYVAEGLIAHPWHISYFNELIGSKNNAYKYLCDSNLDWGQGLKELGKYVKKRDVQTIYLSYFGNGDPHYYGINYVPYFDWNDLNYSQFTESRRLGKDTMFYLKEGQPVLYAVSAMHRSYGYVEECLKNVPCEKLVANSIFVYNLSGYPEALKVLRQRIKSREQYYYIKASQSQAKGELDKAIKFYKRYLEENDPFHVQSWFKLGNAYYDNNEYRKAMESYQKAIELNANYYEAYICYNKCRDRLNMARKYDNFMIGFAYQKTGNYNNAIKCYIEHLKSNPSSFQAWFNLGYAYMDKLEYRKAIDCFKITLKIKPDYEEASECIFSCKEKLTLR